MYCIVLFVYHIYPVAITTYTANIMSNECFAFSDSFKCD